MAGNVMELSKVSGLSWQSRPPMMTHVYERADGSRLVAGKGAMERIMSVCKLSDADRDTIVQHAKALGSHGYRIIAVASARHTDGALPTSQDDFHWQFQGLLALYDPPKKMRRQ